MSSKTHGHMNAASNNEMDVCADCSQPNPIWASINHGTLVCDQCAIIHRTLGRFISQIKPWKQTTCWKLTQLQMVFDLYRSGSNSIWEHTLLDPLSSGSTMSHNIKGLTGSHSSYPRRKPQPNDPLYPHKSDFIRAKYQFLAYVNKSNGIKDDVESESDISEQLHSSVRTPNLKTSLRLLVAGANPNYIHSEKFNSPLHMAARSGQMSQIELLLIYGANLAVVDSKNKSAIDYAKEAGHQDIVYRLIEHQFDLSDTLTRFICQGRQPNHRNGEHFLIVDIKSDFLNYLENNNNNNGNSAGNENDNQRQILETFRNELHQSIRQLSHKSFQELARDVFDELDRREINSFVTSFYSNENGKLSILHQQLSIPFLPVYQYFSPTRNQGRQKLALLNTKEFTLLIVDVLNEIRRRVYGLPTIGRLRKDDSNRNPNELDDEDSEPLYDSVPSEEDYDECNEVIISSNNQPMSLPLKLSKNEPKYTSIHNNKNNQKDENDFVSMSEYIALKEQIIKSTGLMEVFLSDNKLMRNEMSRLQTIVEKLVDENVQLRQQLINFVPPPPTLSSCTSSPQNSSSLLRSFYLNHNNNGNEHKSNSMLIESSSEQLNHDNNSGGGGGSFHNNNHVQINDNNRIRPRSMSNHHLTNNNNNNNNYNDQINTSNNQKNQLLSNEQLLTTIKSPSNLNQLALSVSPTKSSNSSISNYFSPSSSSSLIQQQQRNISPHFNQIFNPSEMFTTNSSSSPPSSSSSLSSQIPLQQHQQQQPCQNSVGPPLPPVKSSALNTAAAAVVSSSPSPSFPTKDDVIKKIEFITNGIKLLLLKAKEGKHDEFEHCSERICNYVSDMINLFPESIESSKMDNLLQLNQALLMLQNNVMQLHDECHTYENVPRFQHCNTSQDNRHIYNMVIDKAAEVAASVKSIINLYTIQANSVGGGGGGLNNNHNTTNSGKIQSNGGGGNITTTNPQTPGSNPVTPPSTTTNNTTTTMASVDRLS